MVMGFGTEYYQGMNSALTDLRELNLQHQYKLQEHLTAHRLSSQQASALNPQPGSDNFQRQHTASPVQQPVPAVAATPVNALMPGSRFGIEPAWNVQHEAVRRSYFKALQR
jgi:hypothetical protein